MNFDERNQLLDTNWGGITFREMTRITFCQYVLGKLNGLKHFDYRVQELSAACQQALSRTMGEDEKLEKLEKLKALGVEIP